MLTLMSSPEGNIREPDKPLVCTDAQVAEAHQIVPHQHSRGQMLYASRGNVSVSVDTMSWHLTPGMAVWIPPDAHHSVRANCHIRYCSVYVDPFASRKMPAQAGVVSTRPLFRELIETAAAFGSEYRADSAESRLLSVLHDQMRQVKTETLVLVMPQRPMLRKLCEHILKEPCARISLAEWSRQCGATERHLARLFKQQTGSSYSHWCTLARANYAIALLRTGFSVTYVASELEFSSSSAFCAMFKRVSGQTVGEYMLRYRV